MPQTPSRFLSGVATQKPNTLYGNYPFPCPPDCGTYFNDFFTYLAGDWTVAPATGTSVLNSQNGGVLRLTTGAVSGNGQGNALNPASITITPGFQSWFAILITLPLTSVPNFIVGLTAGGANAPTNGVYFSKPTVSQVVSMIINKASTPTTMTNTTTCADATQLALGWFYDGRPTPTLYGFSSTALTSLGYLGTAFAQPQIFGGAMFGAMGGDQTVAAALQPLTNLPIVALQPSFFVQTNAASAVTMDVDYVFGSTEIPRF
jgi:hypothetical protein